MSEQGKLLRIEGHYIMTHGSTFQDDVVIFSVYMCNKEHQNTEGGKNEWKSNVKHRNTVIFGDFNDALSEMDRPSKQKIIKVTVALKTINVTDIYKLFHWTAVNSFFLKPTWSIHQDRPLVQFSHSAASDSLRPHGLQHARLPCPSPTPGVYPNSCPLSWWCH